MLLLVVISIPLALVSHSIFFIRYTANKCREEKKVTGDPGLTAGSARLLKRFELFSPGDEPNFLQNQYDRFILSNLSSKLRLN